MRRGPTASALATCLTAVSAVTVIVGGFAPTAAAAVVTPPPPPTRLLANWGFETARFTGEVSAYTCDAGTSVSQPGYKGVGYGVTGTPTATSVAGCSATVPVRPNFTYRLSADVRGGQVVLGTEFGTVTRPAFPEWIGLSTQFTPGPTTSTVRVFFQGVPGGGRFEVDNVELVGMDSTVLTPAGPPTAIVAEQQTSNSVQLSWVGVHGSKLYIVYHGDEPVAYGWGGTESAKVTGLAPGTTLSSSPSRRSTPPVRPALRADLGHHRAQVRRPAGRRGKGDRQVATGRDSAALEGRSGRHRRVRRMAQRGAGRLDLRPGVPGPDPARRWPGQDVPVPDQRAELGRRGAEVAAGEGAALTGGHSRPVALSSR